MGEVAGWVVVAIAGTYSMIHFDELKGLMASAIGLQAPATSTAETQTAEANAGETSVSGAAVELKAGSNGHFHADAEINGREVKVMVDTGATMVALTYEDAQTAGIYLKSSDFTHRVSTANGTARIAPVTIGRIRIGDIIVRNVEASVSEPGRLTTTLLGMSFLRKLDRVDMRAGVLVLQD